MAARQWNETGRVWEEDHGLLDEEQIAKCVRADEGDVPLARPHADDLER